MGVATISCGDHWVGHRCQRRDNESFQRLGCAPLIRIAVPRKGKALVRIASMRGNSDLRLEKLIIQTFECQIYIRTPGDSYGKDPNTCNFSAFLSCPSGPWRCPQSPQRTSVEHLLQRDVLNRPIRVVGHFVKCTTRNTQRHDHCWFLDNSRGEQAYVIISGPDWRKMTM